MKTDQIFKTKIEKSTDFKFDNTVDQIFQQIWILIMLLVCNCGSGFWINSPKCHQTIQPPWCFVHNAPEDRFGFFFLVAEKFRSCIANRNKWIPGGLHIFVFNKVIKCKL